MIKILTAFKIIDDFDDVLPSDWEDLGSNPPDTSYCKRILNCFDEAALENALLLRDELIAAGQEVQHTALTVCPGYSEHILKNLPAIKFDRVCVIETDADLRFDPMATASIIADFVKNDGGFDLILAGKQAPPGNSGIVPFGVANLLGMDIITDVVELTFGHMQGTIRVTHALDEGICVQDAVLPLVLTMGNTTRSYLRMPTLREKLATKSYSPEQLQSSPTRSSGWELNSLIRERDERQCELFAGASPTEMAAKIFERHIKGVLG
ncbi:MAG: electron transfer flavoprotein subunit beta/FixA family protein [Christensenellales bacterium]|jgi:electron transfer flavoprotein beta subunit